MLQRSNFEVKKVNCITFTDFFLFLSSTYVFFFVYFPYERFSEKFFPVLLLMLDLLFLTFPSSGDFKFLQLKCRFNIYLIFLLFFFFRSWSCFGNSKWNSVETNISRLPNLSFHARLRFYGVC